MTMHVINRGTPIEPKTSSVIGTPNGTPALGKLALCSITVASM